MEDIATLPLISYRDRRSLLHLENVLRGHVAEPRVVFRSDDNGAVQGMVGAGLGVALVPALAFDARDPGVVALPLGDAVPPRILCLVWHRGSTVRADCDRGSGRRELNAPETSAAIAR